MDVPVQVRGDRRDLGETGAHAARGIWLFVKLNPLIVAGLATLLLVALMGVVGSQFANPSLADPGAVMPDQSPSAEFPLGTDSQGRSLLAVTLLGIAPTLYVGFVAGGIGLGIGTILGFVGGYFGGILDNIFKGAADILITVPILLVLVVIAVSVSTAIDVTMQAMIIASVAWMWPTRTIRSQVLSMRERAYVNVSKLSGANSFEVIFLEMLPNLLPYLMASFVTAVAVAILSTIGMDALGLGPQNQPTTGNTIYWALFYSAPLRGIWWWWAPQIVVLALVFIGLYLVSAGLDLIANPKLRKAG